MTGPVRVAYDALITANELKPDPAQARAVGALDKLASAIGNPASWEYYRGVRPEE